MTRCDECQPPSESGASFSFFFLSFFFFFSGREGGTTPTNMPGLLWEGHNVTTSPAATCEDAVPEHFTHGWLIYTIRGQAIGV